MPFVSGPLLLDRGRGDVQGGADLGRSPACRVAAARQGSRRYLRAPPVRLLLCGCPPPCACTPCGFVLEPVPIFVPGPADRRGRRACGAPMRMHAPRPFLPPMRDRAWRHAVCPERCCTKGSALLVRGLVAQLARASCPWRGARVHRGLPWLEVLCWQQCAPGAALRPAGHRTRGRRCVRREGGRASLRPRACPSGHGAHVWTRGTSARAGIRACHRALSGRAGAGRRGLARNLAVFRKTKAGVSCNQKQRRRSRCQPLFLWRRQDFGSGCAVAGCAPLTAVSRHGVQAVQGPGCAVQRGELGGAGAGRTGVAGWRRRAPEE